MNLTSSNIISVRENTPSIIIKVGNSSLSVKFDEETNTIVISGNSNINIETTGSFNIKSKNLSMISNDEVYIEGDNHMDLRSKRIDLNPHHPPIINNGKYIK